MDIQGNVLEVIDARNNTAEGRIYGMLGQSLVVESHDAGDRWHLLNSLGQPMRTWDSRDQRFSFTYDTLRRPVDRTVSVDGGAETLLGRIVYGDLLAEPEDTNHVGRVYRVYDGAGVATTHAFDFKGQPTSEERQLVEQKTAQADWTDLMEESTIAAMATAAETLLDPETFTASSQRDALGRVLVAISPDSSEVLYTYDEGGGLQKVELKHRGSSTAQVVVGDITYNARGQREQVIYGSTSSPTMTTSYGYDPRTFRLAHMSTIRESDEASLQGLHYHYDPVGNITDIRDTAQQTVYFQNTVVPAANSYEYDAVYRLIEATGREHASQGTAQRTHEQLPIGPQPMTSDPAAMRLYTQKYTYDSVGNILKMQHIPTSGGGWTRYYEYYEDGNRLEATSAPGDEAEGPYTHTYSYDEHGSMTEMPHLSSMIWNHDDELREVTVGTETVYFQYAGGMRSRKYTVKQGAVTEERIYLGPFEIYRKRVSDELELERESLHISDGTGRICIVETKTFDEEVVSSPVGIWRYQLGNNLGSAATEVDEEGEVISYEEYHPYGTSAYRAVDSSVDVSAKRYRYTGMERDEETGLAYHSARYYAVWLGRWTSPDPFGLVDGPGRYCYSRGNPVRLSDPGGRLAGGPTEKEIQSMTEAEFTRFQRESQSQLMEDATPKSKPKPAMEGKKTAEGRRAKEDEKTSDQSSLSAESTNAPDLDEVVDIKISDHSGNGVSGEGGTATQPKSSEGEQTAAFVAVVTGEELDTTSGETRMGLKGGLAEPGTEVSAAEIVAATVLREALWGMAFGILGFAGRALRKLKLNKYADRLEGFIRKLGDLRSPNSSTAHPSLLPPAARGGGRRGKNHLKPDPGAQGPHSTFKRDPTTGNITGHAEWQPNPSTPSGFDQTKRIDTQYAKPHTHHNKTTGQQLSVPHAHDRSAPGGVRPARPDELPR